MTTARQVQTATGDPAWLVESYDEVRALLQERLLGRAHRHPERASRTSRSALFGGPHGNDPDGEPARAAERRRQLAPAFSARRVQLMRPRIRQLATGLVDAMLAGGPPADLHEAVAFPLPCLVICELLGVPYADRESFRRWADEAADTVDEQRSVRGVGALWAYIHGLAERKLADPADDVLSDLVAAADGPDPITDVAALGAGLLFAGFETTVTAIDRAVLLLTTHPEQWRALCADHELVPAAVEETLRSGWPAGMRTRTDGGLPRYAAAELDLGEVTVAEGDLVLLGLDAANHDAATFPEPERFDITRSPNPHLTFGYGPRFCQGVALARAELAEVLTALAGRVPGLRLAVPVDELRLVPDRLVGSVSALPVTW
ncbi:cytochrome P450 [Pseudonocardia sp. CA-107938]|uniref:cytochrome P450 n=1 Tax=Pseudonocardia sp. CA-107938 TaxID=3240021 RepID=UPI003D9119E7